MSQLKMYSQLSDAVIDVGPKTEDLDKLLGLADLVIRPDTIVYIQGPALQKWGDS